MWEREISPNNIAKHLNRHKNNPDSFLGREGKYKLNHDGLICQFCGKECKNRNSLCNHERLCKENPDRQDYIKIGFNNKGHKAWNKGLTKDTDERVSRGAETFKKHVLEGKVKLRYGNLNSSSTQEVKDKISKTCLMRSAEGRWHKSLAKDMHYSYNGVDLDGTWELSYAIYLDENKILWNRCSERFPYEMDGKVHFYTPDFYLIESDIYVEIKGYQTDKDILKWSQFPKDKKLVILKYKELKELGVL